MSNAAIRETDAQRWPIIAAPYGSLASYRLKTGEMGSGDLELVWWYDGPICKIRRPDGRLVSVMLDLGDEAELIMLPGRPT